MTKLRTHACLDCTTLVTAKAKRCKSCCARHIALDPVLRQSRAETAIRNAANPDFRARQAEVLRRNREKAQSDPAFRAWMVENGKRSWGHMFTPEARAANAAKRGQAGRKRTETTIGWCPPEWRDHLRRLRKKGIKTPEARLIIKQYIETERRATCAEMSPFERQEHALRNGARLVEVRPLMSHHVPGFSPFEVRR